MQKFQGMGCEGVGVWGGGVCIPSPRTQLCITQCVWMLLRMKHTHTHTHAYSAGKYTQLEASLWGPSLKRRLIYSS